LLIVIIYVVILFCRDTHRTGKANPTQLGLYKTSKIWQWKCKQFCRIDINSKIAYTTQE